MYQPNPIICTLNKIPLTESSLRKSRLPFAIHITPFAQDRDVPVVEGPIRRCAYCRAYINKYIRVTDRQYWLCNICNRHNELPYDFCNSVELTSESVEYIATEEYMLRPPQPACYMFVFDCSRAAIELNYIPIMATAIAEELDSIPGDARASVGFIAFDSAIHYFSFTGSQVVHHVCADVSADITPCTIDGILIKMIPRREAILDFLTQFLPTFPFQDHATPVTDTKSALGSAVKAAVRIMSPIGGRITVIQAQLPNHGCSGDGSILTEREKSITKANLETDKNGDHITPLINPASDFYKNLALECCDRQISIDLFNLSTAYVDLASISPMVKFSAGTVFHYSNSVSERTTTLVRFEQDFRNQLVRRLGLESVLRLRHSRGLKIHTFHGNFFARSTNLLVLPNTNPDASYTLQIAIEDDLKPGMRYVYFQVSVLYTTVDGERRIRVHTAQYPTVTLLSEIIDGADQAAIVAILAKMAVDRSMQANIGEAKEALIGSCVDLLETYALAYEMQARSYSLGLPENLKLVPLYSLALLKHLAFKVSVPVRLDDRIAAMERFKTLPVDELITYIYPDLFPLHSIANAPNDEWKYPLRLTAAELERNGAYLLDAYDVMIIYVCEYIDPGWCRDVFNVNEYAQIPEFQDVYSSELLGQSNQFRPRDPSNFIGNSPSTNQRGDQANFSNYLSGQLPASVISRTPLVKLPALENETSIRLREFIDCLIDGRPQKPKFFILKENSKARALFTQYLVDDRSEYYHSFAEFTKFLQDQARK